MGSPTMAADNSPMVLVLDGFARDMQQAFGFLVAVLINMEVQVQIPLLG